MSAARPSWMKAPREYAFPCIDECGHAFCALIYAGIDETGDYLLNTHFFDNRADAEAFIVGKERITVTA